MIKTNCYTKYENDFSYGKYPLGYLLWQLSNLWQRYLKIKLENTGLTNTQFALLKGLHKASENNDYVTQVELAHQLQINVMMVSQVLRKLEKKKLIMRVEHPQDTRAKCLKLTEEGEKLIKTTLECVLKANSEFFEPLDGDFEKVYNMLEKLIDINSHKLENH